MKKLELLEKRNLKIKRSHGEFHPSVEIYPSAKLRNKIIEHVGSQPFKRIKVSELTKFLNGLKESEEWEGTPSLSWASNNKHLLRKIKVGKESYYKLTRAGVNTFKYLQDQESVDNVHESLADKLTKEDKAKVEQIIKDKKIKDNIQVDLEILGVSLGLSDLERQELQANPMKFI